MIRQLPPIPIRLARNRILKQGSPSPMRIMLRKPHLPRTSQITTRRLKRLRVPKIQHPTTRRRAARGPVLRPVQTVLAVEGQREARRVDGRADLRDCRVARVDVGHSVAGSDAKGGPHVVAVRVSDEEEGVGHGAAEGDAAPAVGCGGIFGGAVLYCCSVLALLLAVWVGKKIWRAYQVSHEFSRIVFQCGAG